MLVNLTMIEAQWSQILRQAKPNNSQYSENKDYGLDPTAGR